MDLPGGWELVLIVTVGVLLFGAKRLPEAARSAGRSLRIFKAETKGLREDDAARDAARQQPYPSLPAAPVAPQQADVADSTRPGPVAPTGDLH